MTLFSPPLIKENGVSTIQTLAGLIVRDQKLGHGQPVVAGTDVTVRTVAEHYKLGLTPEETAEQTGLELALVHAALAYYYLNKEEIEAASEDIQLPQHEARSSEATAHQQQVRDLLAAAGLSQPVPDHLSTDSEPLSTERRAELAQRFSIGRPLSELILEEREDYQSDLS